MVALILLLSTSLPNYSQKHNLSIGIGASNLLGDLGGENDIGSVFYKDVEWKAFRPSVQVSYRHHFNYRWSISSSLMLTQVVGNDAWLQPDGLDDPSYYRWYRNLHFKSMILELSVLGEFNILRYVPGSMDYRWTPYVGVGAGLFAFNPKAEYQDNWYALQPLGTEGQGLPGYGNRYKRVQPVFPVSLGFRFNINRKWALGFEFAHRFTLTDYIDDVSTSYVDPADLQANYDDQTANLIYGLSRRSTEVDPSDDLGYITAPGQQRGDPKNNDQYFTSTFYLSYTFGKNHYSCPPKRQFY